MTEAPSPPRNRRLLHWILLAAITLLLAGEIAVRTNRSGRVAELTLQRDESQRSVAAIRDLLPDTLTKVVWPEHPSGTIAMAPDFSTYHRRVFEVKALPEPREERRFLLYGSENVFGVCAPGEHFGAVLSKIHEERVGKFWQTINAGRWRGTLLESYRDYRAHGSGLSHDALIVVVDLSRDPWRMNDTTRWHLDKNVAREWTEVGPAVPESERGLRGLLRKSALFARGEARWEARSDGAAGRALVLEDFSIEQPGRADSFYAQYLAFADRNRNRERSINAIREVLRLFKSEADTQRVPMFVVGLPSAAATHPAQDGVEVAKVLSDRFGLATPPTEYDDELWQRLSEICKEWAVPLLDSREAFAEWERKFPGERVFWRADYNLSSKGHFVLGEWLAGQLEAVPALMAPKGS